MAYIQLNKTESNPMLMDKDTLDYFNKVVYEMSDKDLKKDMDYLKNLDDISLSNMKTVGSPITPILKEYYNTVTKIIRVYHTRFPILSMILMNLCIFILIKQIEDKVIKSSFEYALKNNKRSVIFEKHMEKEINNIYIKHPEYTPCTLKDLKKIGFVRRALSDLNREDVTIKKYIKNRGLWQAIDMFLLTFLEATVPMIGNWLLLYPIKIFLYNLGLNVGPFSNYIMEYKGNSVSFGLQLRPIGLILTGLEMFVFKKDKLYRCIIADPPIDIMKITKQDIDMVMQNYKGKFDENSARKLVAKFNECFSAKHVLGS